MLGTVLRPGDGAPLAKQIVDVQSYSADTNTQISTDNNLTNDTVTYNLGTFLYGPMDRVFDSRKRVVLGGAWIMAAHLGALAALDRPGLRHAVLETNPRRWLGVSG